MQGKWGTGLLLVLTCAVLFGSIGYFFGGRSRGTVYQISGAQSSAPYEVAEETDTQPDTEDTQPASAETEEEDTGLVDINRADVAELMTLPGIGEVRAQAIVDYRTANGSFQTVEELLLVSGIGESTLEGLRELVTVGTD